jgi:uncharacterized protein (TIGR03435 family)
MKRNNANRDRALDRLLARHNAPSPERMEPAIDRVAGRLRSGIHDAPAEPIVDADAGRKRREWRFMVSSWMPVAAAAAVMLAASAALMWIAFVEESSQPIVRAVEGVVYRSTAASSETLEGRDDVSPSEMLRTRGDAGAQLTLADGSRVEMRPQSALWIERADDGLRIHLSDGGIIVNAAKQRTGHLYVQTNDVTASVVGTVFLVNTEEAGSRVAVIEGEVRVQQGTTEKTLRPGQQVSTNPRPSTPLRDAIAWSRQASAHRALLQQSAPRDAAAAGAPSADTRPRFDVVSVRPCAPGDVRGAGGGTAGSSPDRLHLHCQQLWGLIQGAYVLFADGQATFGRIVPIEGAPDWLKSAFYTIEATAEGAPSWGMKNGPMLQTLLEDRFKLKIRRETREVPVYALTVASGGFELAALEDGACVPMPPLDFSKPPLQPEPGQKPFCRGMFGQKLPNLTWDVQGMTLDDIARGLGTRVDRPVINRTGIAGRFTFRLEFGADGTMARPGGDAGFPSADSSAAASIFTVLEDELGLKLEPSTGPGTALVIDHVERPAEN